MVNKMLLAVMFLAAMTDAHYLDRYSHDSDSDTVKQRVCSSTNACPADAVCCLKAYQGRCYYGSYSYFYGYQRTPPTESVTCLKADSFGDGSTVGSRCASDSNCAGDMVCDQLSSNRWGSCIAHVCDSDNPCNGHQCVKDTNGPGYTCNCHLDNSGDPINNRADWKGGEHCDEDHLCSADPVHNCGDFGTCFRDDEDADKIKCECDDEWFGEKCNNQGICSQLPKKHTCADGATCTSTGTEIGEYKCDCANVHEEGEDCDEDPCSSGCTGGNGECYVTSTTGTLSHDKDAECRCMVNYYGTTCENPCGGSTVDLPASLEISGSDALCIYDDLAAATTPPATVTVVTTESENYSWDPFCITYYVEAFAAVTNVPMTNDHAPTAVTKNRCFDDTPDTGTGGWEFTTAPDRVEFSVRDGVNLTITVA